MSNSSEKMNFIKRNANTIKPISSDLEVVRNIENDSEVSPAQVDQVLEEFETKVMEYNRADPSVDSKKILLEASQPANFNIIHPLISLLEEDDACGGITLITDNVSGKRFEGEEGKLLGLESIRNEGEPVLADIPRGPYESALVLDEPINSPNNTLLFGSKSIFDAKKLYFFSIGLFDDIVRRISDQSDENHMDSVDAILTADIFTKELMCKSLGIPEEKVLVTGSPLIDQIDLEQGEILREKGRETLHIPSSAVVAFHSSIIASAFEKVGGASDINQQTYERVLEGVIAGAEANPEQEYVLLLRTHPRMKATDPFPLPPHNLPSNLRIVLGDDISYEENIYASDILLCNILSTETLLARYRGKTAAVFNYEGEGQFAQVIDKLYGQEGIRVIEESARATLVDSSESLSVLLTEYQPQLPIQKPAGDSLGNIKKILLSK